MTDHEVPPNVGISLGAYREVTGYKYLNIFVRYTQPTASEPPVDLGIIFAFDAARQMGSRRYVNLESNVPSPQATNFISVSGANAWHGSQWGISTSNARVPVMGPFVQVFVYNTASTARRVSVWGVCVAIGGCRIRHSGVRVRKPPLGSLEPNSDLTPTRR